MTLPVLRPAHSVENLEWNFRALLGALQTIDGNQILPGTLPDSAFTGNFLPLSGGTMTGPLAALSLTVGGVGVALDTDLGLYYTKTAADAQFATLALTYSVSAADAQFATQDVATTGTAGLVLQAADVADLNQTISGSYTQSEVQALSDKVDELLGALRTAGVLETP